MPTIEDNRTLWGSRYAWLAGGDEWSLRWGGSESTQRAVPARLRRRLVKRGWLSSFGMRAPSVTAALFATYSQRAGLPCVSQELIGWRGSLLLDCFSVFAQPASIWARPNRVYRNHKFVEEVASIGRLSSLYSSPSFFNGG